MYQMFALILSLAAAAGGTSVMAADPAGGGGTISPTAGFDAWAAALEAESLGQEAWIYPFGAPVAADLTSEDLSAVLELRRLATGGDTPELRTVVDRVVRRQDRLPAQLRFWLAYAQDRLDQHGPSLANLKRLLQTPDGWRTLEIGQRAWVLTATGDLLFKLEHRAEAALYYTRLAASPLSQLHLWGNYQLAGLDFLGRQFAEASRKYDLVCRSDLAATWRDHACAMAEIAGQMDRLLTEGDAHGAAAR